MNMAVDNQYAKSIQRIYPELFIHSVERFGSGQNNDTVLVNSELVFRFPKYEEGIEQLEREAAFLHRIVDRVPMEVPRPIYRSFYPNGIGDAFIGYKKIAGEPLETEMLHTIRDECELRRLAGQLGLFLKQLHTMEPDDIGLYGTADGVYAEWSNMYERIQTKLYPYMKQEARHWTDFHFTGFLKDKGNFEIAQVPIHGDFGTSNILYDSHRRHISGIIDFGSAGIGDPAVDYAGLLASYGERFFRFVADEYPEATDMMDRIVFYHGTFALQEALFGIENNDPAAFRNGMERFR